MKSSKKGISIILDRFKNVLTADPLDDETDTGDGYWFYLQPGFCTKDDGLHVVHEYTIAVCYGVLSRVKPCDCTECRKRPPLFKAKEF